ncbi:exosortase C-terminal domain/associated protein EpsI [Sphingomonas sp. 37zxx]|uniref:exosortase C-terminal domain/associated protein EpsI n=1 Tax=Sphingomonas sp. 37zxx TaxID=1550073 RepID=UPI0006913D2D|nr:exosortase C-terminal domain/associated protein EpsI [Sphingomonas sp. 37zxx]
MSDLQSTDATELPLARTLGRRDLLMGGICCAGAVLGSSTALWSSPRALPAGGLQALIPAQIGTWTLATTYGVVVTETGENARGPYDDLLTRIYQSSVAPPVTLLVAYVGSQRADVRLHRPEACYPAAGFKLSDSEPVDLRFADTPLIAAQMVLAESAMRSEQLLYWTRVGNAFPRTNVAQVGAFLKENIRGNAPDGILVRLSVPGRDRVQAAKAFRGFLTALLAIASPEAKRALFGQQP